MRRLTGALGVVALSGLVGTACSSAPSSSGSGQGAGTTTSTGARLPPRTHSSGSTSTTTAGGVGAGTSTTVGGGGPGGSGPTLGVASAWGPAAVGFGQVKPTEISLGGDPTGLVTGIYWQSWGGSQATGSGASTYVGPNQAVAQGTQETATVIASDLGTCDGKPAYQQVKWYFPSEGETLSTGETSTVNACTGP